MTRRAALIALLAAALRLPAAARASEVRAPESAPRVAPLALPAPASLAEPGAPGLVAPPASLDEAATVGAVPALPAPAASAERAASAALALLQAAPVAPSVSPAAAAAAYAKVQAMAPRSEAPAARAEGSRSPLTIEGDRVLTPAVRSNALLSASVPAAVPGQAESAEASSARAGALFGEDAGAARAPPVETPAEPLRAGRSWLRLSLRSSRRDPAAGVPPARKPRHSFTRNMILANVLVFPFGVLLEPLSSLVFGFTPAYARAVVALGDPIGVVHVALTTVTYMFIHGSFAHIFGNMAIFALFGRSVEAALGRAGAKKLFYASGIAGALAAALLDWPGTMPIIGASGAISGVIAAYLVLWKKKRLWASGKAADPRAAVHRIIGIAVGLFGAWLLVQNVLALLFQGAHPGGVEVVAHVGGTLVGALYAWRLTRRPVAE